MPGSGSTGTKLVKLGGEKLRMVYVKLTVKNTNLSLTECAVRTVSYVSSPCGPSAKSAGHKKRGENEDK